MDAAFTATNLAAISWSAGKDSCLALLRARDAGLDVRGFLTLLDPGGLSKSHALPRDLIAAQVRALGGQWWPAEAGPGAYVLVFAAQLRALREAGHRHLVFGDIDLQAHRDWLEPACAAAGLQAPAGVCPAGEGGEFHSFVWDAPGFAAPLPVRPGPLRRMASAPPLSPTTLVLQTPSMERPGAADGWGNAA